MITLLLIWQLGVADARMSGAPEYQVKAALLLNLTRFIEWPTAAFPRNQKEIHICVLGKDPFGDALDTIKGKQSRGRKVVILRSQQWVTAMSRCQLLFLASSEQAKLRLFLSLLKTYPVLTVSDMGGFAKAGGMIRIGTTNRRASLFINIKVAKQQGFKISAPLLELSTQVTSP